MSLRGKTLPDPAAGKGYATFADCYYERAPFPLWQLFWVPKNSCFPYPADMAGLQPDLTVGGYGGRSA